MKLEAGRLALKGFSFSIDARVSMMASTAAAYGKRKSKSDRWARLAMDVWAGFAGAYRKACQ